MTTDERLASLRLKIDAGPDADDDTLDRLTLRLRSEIEDSGIEADLVKTGPAPEGAMSAEAVLLGALVITMVPGAINNLVDLLRDFSSRPGNRHAKIVLEGQPELLNAALANAGQAASVHYQTGGMNIEADEIGVKGDLVGRDKNITINVAAGAIVQIDNTGNVTQPAATDSH